MKKFISILVTLLLVFGTSTVAFAEAGTGSTSLTPEQQQERDEYLKIHFDLMNQLVELRQQTREAVESNNAVLKQIKGKVKPALNKDSISKLKDLANQRKALLEQASQLHQQRLSLRLQYKEAVASKDLNKMKTIEQQILDINKQISDIKAQNTSIKTQIAPLKEQIKNMRDVNKELKENVKDNLQEVKSLGQAIKLQQQEKAQLWATYKENIKNRDYKAAEATFRLIIEKKALILENIKQRGIILNQILASLS